VLSGLAFSSFSHSETMPLIDILVTSVCFPTSGSQEPFHSTSTLPSAIPRTFRGFTSSRLDSQTEVIGSSFRPTFPALLVWLSNFPGSFSRYRCVLRVTEQDLQVFMQLLNAGDFRGHCILNFSSKTFPLPMYNRPLTPCNMQPSPYLVGKRARLPEVSMHCYGYAM
jgi:hypothetical protein